MIEPLSKLTGLVYRNVAKPALFCIPADTVHVHMVAAGSLAMEVAPIRALTSTIFRYDNPLLEQTLAGIELKTPIGLAAGFDYGAHLTQSLEALGFGFQTVGTISNGAYAGNKPPMLGRLPKSQSLWVNKGFKNDGAEAVQKKLADFTFTNPVGISVGATNKSYKNEEEQINEYLSAFLTLDQNTNHAYWELNISCPNLAAGTNFQDPDALQRLLHAVDALELDRPFFIKMPIDITKEQLISLLIVIEQSSAAGIIIGNLTKKADPRQFWLQERLKYDHGGFSGRPTRAKSTELIRTAYHFTEGRLIIIGCGGIFDANDAIAKLKAGASALQLITGMILCGPQIVGQINLDLTRYMKREGYHHLSELVGVE
jgi:dihydroorotate dehydrogenase subfamily 2